MRSGHKDRQKRKLEANNVRLKLGMHGQIRAHCFSRKQQQQSFQIVGDSLLI